MKKVTLLIASLFLFAYGCTDEDTPINEVIQKKDQMETLNAKNSKTVTVPFEANFYTEKTEFTGVYECPPTSGGPNHQVGEGVSTHLGKIDAVMTFCNGAAGAYSNGAGKFIAANGDELFYKIESGLVNLDFVDEIPFYEAWFKDPFTITGGTGRFEGASGSGYTDSYVDLFGSDSSWAEFPFNIYPDHRTDHVWTGTLTFIPGSRSN